MAIATSVRNAEKTRRPSRDKTGARVGFIGADRLMTAEGERPRFDVIYPVAYKVEQGPMKELGAHFHVANQFQLFVGGSGRIGRHPVEIGAGHFSGPYSPYGPIVGGEQGVHYLTLRNSWDGGAQFLPDANRVLRAKPRKFRETVFGPIKEIPAEELSATRELSKRAVMASAEDGLGAWQYRTPPGEVMRGPDPATGGGQYWIVMGGALDHPSEGAMERLSCVFVTPEDAAYEAKAGPGGAQVLVMQFPVFVPVD